MTTSTINGMAVDLISKLDIWDSLDKTGIDDNYRIMKLGYISGVTEFAKVLCDRISEEAVGKAIEEYGRKEI